ncbi:hypothetical protein HN958_00745 [Candidatus Falkowbacteria bacterium]|jgi:hypothetical protein|nr:hypothetical protein [Candidatus Falkowbacteria bacterium]MBT7007018.1 hypothetical protein [Candidatus Falkowbacteria bacterium]
MKHFEMNKVLHPTTSRKPDWPSCFGILVIFTIGICLMGYYWPEEPETPVTLTRNYCQIGNLVTLDKASMATTDNHLIISYFENGGEKTNRSCFSQIRFNELQKMAEEKSKVCIVYDANEKSAIGLFRPR